MGAEVMVESNGALVEERVRHGGVGLTVVNHVDRNNSLMLAALLADGLRKKWPGVRFWSEPDPSDDSDKDVTVRVDGADESTFAEYRAFVDGFLACLMVADSGAKMLYERLTPETRAEVDAAEEQARADTEARLRNYKGPLNCQGRPAPPRERKGGYVCPACFADCRATGTT